MKMYFSSEVILRKYFSREIQMTEFYLFISENLRVRINVRGLFFFLET